MKKRMNGLLTTLTACAMVVIMMSAMPADNIMTKENDTTIINTNLLGKGIKGFKGTTPVKIYIKQAKTLQTEYNGKSVSKAAKMDVDGVSGATYSSKALKKNVQLGLEYYKKNN